MRAALRRVPVERKERQRSKIRPFPAAIRGWVANENLANAQPGGCFILENGFPTQTGVRIRKGQEKFATIGANPVESMFSYQSGALDRIFATDSTNIFDITTVVDPDTPPTAAVTAQTSGYYSTLQFETAGGDFLYAVNGTDSPQLYDGSTWMAVTDVSSPGITGVTTSDLIQAWVYRNRIYFVEKNSMSAWYLPVDSLGGAAEEFSLRGIFQKGGKLILGATWSLDAGDGVDDKAVFISDQGEVAIYEGSYPGAGEFPWSLVGVYQITAPLGKNATMRAGGDLLVLTEDGIVPISAAIHKDSAALSLAAITRPIEPEWQKEVQVRQSNGPWEILKWPSHNMAIVALPLTTTSEETAKYCFVVNVETGAWAKWVGVAPQCLTVHAGWAYFGTIDGTIMKAESTGADDGSLYEFIYVPHFDHMKGPAVNKHVLMVRATFRASQPFNPQFSVATDYNVSLPATPTAATTSSGDIWDTGLWDTAVWDGGGVMTTTTRWVSAGRNGTAISAAIQISSGNSVPSDVELISTEILYEDGGVAV